MKNKKDAEKKIKISKKAIFYPINNEEKELQQISEKIKSKNSAYFYGGMTSGAAAAGS